MSRGDIIQDSLDELTKLLGEDDPRVQVFRRDVAGDAVARLVQGLLADACLKDELTSRALWLAPLVPSEGVVTGVVNVLTSRPGLAGLAAEALTRIRQRSTLAELEAILIDPTRHPGSRAAAARAMSWLFDSDIKEVFRSILRSEDESAVVILQVLESLGSSQLHEGTTDAACDICLFLQSPVPDVRSAAATTLGNIGAKRVIPQLKALLGDRAVTTSGTSVGEEIARVISLLRRSPRGK